MKNDIIARAEQLGHEAEGLRYFLYDVRVSNPTIYERIIGKFKKVKQNISDEETTYLFFGDDTSELGVAYGLSFIEKLLSGKVFDFQIFHACRDREKLVALIEEQHKEELRRKRLEKMSSVDWEERTWQLLSKFVAINELQSYQYTSTSVETLIKRAHDAVEKYKKSMEEEE